MTLNIGDKVTVYKKEWVINNVTNASTVKRVYPAIGGKMQELRLTLLSLEAASAETIDLGIMRIHGQRKTTNVFIDDKGCFHDPDKLMPELAESIN